MANWVDFSGAGNKVVAEYLSSDTDRPPVSGLGLVISPAPPYLGGIYDPATKRVSGVPTPPVTQPTRAEEIANRDISTGPPPTQKDTSEACQEILKKLLGL